MQRSRRVSLGMWRVVLIGIVVAFAVPAFSDVGSNLDYPFDFTLDLTKVDLTTYGYIEDVSKKERINERIDIYFEGALRAPYNVSAHLAFLGGLAFGRDIQGIRDLLQELYISKDILGEGMVFEVTGGRQTYKPGVVDGPSPLEFLNPSDYWDYIDTHDIGVTTIAFKTMWGNHSINTFVVPVFEPIRYPHPKSRFLQAFPDQVSTELFGDIALEGVDWSESATPSVNQFSSPGVGAIANFSLHQVDLRGLFYRGWVPYPQTVVRETMPIQNVVGIPTAATIDMIPVYNRFMVGGMAGTVVVNPFILKLETAYFNAIGSSQADISPIDDLVKFASALEWRKTDFYEHHSVNLTFQYNREFLGDSLGDAQLFRSFANTITSIIDYQWNQDAKFKVLSAFEVGSPANVMIQADFEYYWNANFTFAIGTTVVNSSGDRGDLAFYNDLEQIDRGYAKITALF